ncbi:18441_t:CDS:2, partial [Racocetra fulgida]
LDTQVKNLARPELRHAPLMDTSKYPTVRGLTVFKKLAQIKSDFYGKSSDYPAPVIPATIYYMKLTFQIQMLNDG